jgi:4-diphosphocytidyl-2-C-methyl-D-erythritol kinase
MQRLAHAKINLYLDIMGRRPDGYHTLETVFQKLDLADQLDYEPKPPNGLTLDMRGEQAVENLNFQDNLVIRAANALAQAAHIKLAGNFRLEKNIPAGGGLGGGSSDAASALLLLRDAYKIEMSDTQLQYIAARLGADIPFFLFDQPCAIARGIGEELTALKHNADCHVVLALPGYPVSTPEAFKQFDNKPSKPQNQLSKLLAALESNDIPAILDASYNALEAPAFALHPELGHLRDTLEKLARQPVRMTGSGSTLFTLCKTKKHAQDIADAWTDHCKTVLTRFTPFAQ